jgi:hypothetical protein
MNYIKKVESHSELEHNRPVFGVPVPNYNAERPRVQDKKTWQRWDFLRRWRRFKGSGVKSQSVHTTGATGAERGR